MAATNLRQKAIGLPVRIHAVCTTTGSNVMKLSKTKTKNSYKRSSFWKRATHFRSTLRQSGPNL